MFEPLTLKNQTSLSLSEAARNVRAARAELKAARGTAKAFAARVAHFEAMIDLADILAWTENDRLAEQIRSHNFTGTRLLSERRRAAVLRRKLRELLAP